MIVYGIQFQSLWSSMRRQPVSQQETNSQPTTVTLDDGLGLTQRPSQRHFCTLPVMTRLYTVIVMHVAAEFQTINREIQLHKKYQRTSYWSFIRWVCVLVTTVNTAKRLNTPRYRLRGAGWGAWPNDHAVGTTYGHYLANTIKRSIIGGDAGFLLQLL